MEVPQLATKESFWQTKAWKGEKSTYTISALDNQRAEEY